VATPIQREPASSPDVGDGQRARCLLTVILYVMSCSVQLLKPLRPGTHTFSEEFSAAA
jgi:hypothetical protein